MSACSLRRSAISKIESSLLSIGYLDLLSYRDSPVHRIDPRAKLITTLIFILTVVSFGRYEVSMLMPFVIYPVYLIASGDLPALYLLKKVVYVSPFAVMIGIFNPILDSDVLFSLGGIAVSGGWVSFCSIMVRFLLTVSTALAMIACTGFHNVCMALDRLGAPQIFAVQLLFLYRYLFVLAEEAARMVRARNLRSFDGRGGGIKIYGTMLGHLLLRTINRAQRIHLAMSCRGFDGRIRVMKTLNFGGRDLMFILSWSALFVLFRFFNLPNMAGNFITGFFI